MDEGREPLRKNKRGSPYKDLMPNKEVSAAGNVQKQKINSSQSTTDYKGAFK